MHRKQISNQSDVQAVVLFDRFYKNKSKTRITVKEDMCVCVHACVRVLGGEEIFVFASTALVVVWMAMYIGPVTVII